MCIFSYKNGHWRGEHRWCPSYVDSSTASEILLSLFELARERYCTILSSEKKTGPN